MANLAQNGDFSMFPASELTIYKVICQHLYTSHWFVLLRKDEQLTMLRICWAVALVSN